MNAQEDYGIKMIPEEIEQQMEFAQQAYNKFIEVFDGVYPSYQLFLLGFLHGRQHTLQDIGIFEEPHDEDKIYDALRK